ncbi:MAG: hypothetical protein PHO01_05615 [Desulfotomaculaceae bacterium]|nr:hypothetical protein [Desulfotomaculaceae bacterium]
MAFNHSSQLKGKYVPDQDGKLRPILNLIEFNINVPVSASNSYYGLLSNSDASWYKKVWLWIKDNIT